jgi:hypothetical protein
MRSYVSLAGAMFLGTVISRTTPTVAARVYSNSHTVAVKEQQPIHTYHRSHNSPRDNYIDDRYSNEYNHRYDSPNTYTTVEEVDSNGTSPYVKDFLSFRSPRNNTYDMYNSRNTYNTYNTYNSPYVRQSVMQYNSYNSRNTYNTFNTYNSPYVR